MSTNLYWQIDVPAESVLPRALKEELERNRGYLPKEFVFGYFKGLPEGKDKENVAKLVLALDQEQPIRYEIK